MRVVVYSITDPSSFDAAETLLTDADPRTPLILIGNKLDEAKSKRAVTEKDGREMAMRCNVGLFMESSAKTGHNVAVLFERACEMGVLVRRNSSENLMRLRDKGRARKPMQRSRSMFQLRAPSLDLSSSRCSIQ